MPAAGVVTIEVIASVGEIVEKSQPVAPVVDDINEQLDAAVSALEGLLVKKAGMSDALGLVDGLYPGAGTQGFRAFPDSREIVPPRIAEVYTKGTLTLARLGREAPIATGNPAGPALRDPAYGSAAARTLYAGARPTRSPVIGTGAPVVYEEREDTGKPRRRFRPTMGR